mgnify:CR=1 FL=1
MTMDRTIVIFGAGKIGRSFIGQLFSRSGYRAVFIDIFAPVIEELNRRGGYEVVIKGEQETVIPVTNVSGIRADQSDKVAEAVARADIAATCVGKNALPSVFPLITAGLEKRAADSGESNPLDIIIAENIRDARKLFSRELRKQLHPGYPFDTAVGLVETSIGKMVPIMSRKDIEEDPLRVFAEPYNTLIVDRNGFRNEIPEIPGLAPKDNMKAWVDRKLFIHNLGHAVTAYAGYVHDPGMKYIYEVLASDRLCAFVRGAMTQSARALEQEYSGEFTSEDLDAHISDLVSRFQNRALGDTVYRVGRDIRRKLGPRDRLAGAVRLCIRHSVDITAMLWGLVCGYFFRSTDEEGRMFPGDREVERDFFSRGPRFMLTEVSGFNPGQDDEIIKQGELFFKRIQQGKLPWKG